MMIMVDSTLCLYPSHEMTQFVVLSKEVISRLCTLKSLRQGGHLYSLNGLSKYGAKIMSRFITEYPRASLQHPHVQL